MLVYVYICFLDIYIAVIYIYTYMFINSDTAFCILYMLYRLLYMSIDLYTFSFKCLSKIIEDLLTELK